MESPISLPGAATWSRSCTSEGTSDWPRRRLKAAAHAMIFLHRISPRKGVRMEHVLERHRRNTDQSFLYLSCEEQDFASGVLALPALLLKSSQILLRFQQKLEQVKYESSTEEADFFGEFAWSALAQSVHDMKLITARQCWSRFVRPKREEVQELKRRYEMLQSQFRKARTAYLHEISATRDEIRGPRAGSEEASVESADIINLFDPTLSVEPTEINFFCNAVTEKLKMILEVNPSVAQSCNLSQLQLLLHAKESNEVTELRGQLKRRANEISELRNTIVDLQRIVASESRRKPGVDAEPKQMLNAQSVVSDLEDQLKEARNKLRKENVSLEQLLQDHEELRLAYEGEISERVALQKTLEVERKQHTLAQATAEEQQAGVEQKQENWAERVETLEVQLSAASTEARDLRRKLQHSQEVAKRARHRPSAERSPELVLAGEDDLDLNSMPSSVLVTKKSAPNKCKPVIRKAIRRHTFAWFGCDTESSDDRCQDNDGGLSEQIRSKEENCHSECMSATSDLPTTTEVKAMDVPSNESKALSEAASLRIENQHLTEDLAHLKRQLEDMRRQELRRKAEQAVAQASRMTEDLQKQSFSDDAPPALEEETDALMLQADLQAARKHCALVATNMKVLLASENESLPEASWQQQVEEACQQVVQATWQLRSLEARLVAESLSAGELADSDALRQETERMRHLLNNLNATCQDMSQELSDAYEENIHLVTALERLKSKAGKSVAAIRGSRAFPEADPGVRASLKGFEELGRNSVFHRLSVSGRYQSQRFLEFRQRYLEESSRALMACLKLEPGAVEQVLGESLVVRPVEPRGENSRPEPVITSRQVSSGSSQDCEEPMMTRRSSAADGERCWAASPAPQPAAVSAAELSGLKGCGFRPASFKKTVSKVCRALPGAARSHLEPPHVTILAPGVGVLGPGSVHKKLIVPSSPQGLPRLEQRQSQQSPSLLTSRTNHCKRFGGHRSRDHTISPYV